MHIYVHVYIQYVPVVDVVPLISRVEDESAIPNAHIIMLQQSYTYVQMYIWNCTVYKMYIRTHIHTYVFMHVCMYIL